MMGSVEVRRVNNIPSKPPKGKYKVTNIYVNEHGKLVVDYEDVPV